MKIAIVKLSSIGDIAHNAFTPALIKKHMPNAEVHWFCDAHFTEILEGNPHIKSIHSVFSKGAGKAIMVFIKQLFLLRKVGRKQQFDAVIDLQGTFKSALIGRVLKVNKNFYGFRFTRDIIANKLYSKYCYVPLQTNVYQRAIEMLRCALGIEASRNDIKTPFLYTTQQGRGNGNILIFPSSSKIEKNYSVQNFQAIIKQLQSLNITLLFGTKQEEETCKEIAKGLKSVQITGGLSLSKVKELVAQQSVVIGADTGVLHIASALGVQNITLYGPTPAYRTSIFQKHSVSLQGNGNVNSIPIKHVLQHISMLCG